MFVYCELNEGLTRGSIVSEVSNNIWGLAPNASALVGVVSRDAVQDAETQKWSAPVVFAGDCQALAGETIPNGGGFFSVANGRVTLSTDPNLGVIAPNIAGAPDRVKDSFVMIHLR